MEPFIIGFGGVLVGVVLAALFELWRKAMDGQSAARLIRIESLENRVAVTRALTYGYRDEHASREAWDTHRQQIVPFVSELEVMQLAETFSMTDKANRRWLPIAETGGKRALTNWHDRLQLDADILRKIEARNPLALAFTLLRSSRVATPDEIQEAYGISPEAREAIEKEKSDLRERRNRTRNADEQAQDLPSETTDEEGQQQ